MRQIALDTETTGLSVAAGHRIIEIAAVEMRDRRLTGERFHAYLQPDRPIDPGAIKVHGITDDFLADKPRFADVAQEFLDFVRGADLVIHNAAFDVAFLDAELGRLGMAPVSKHCRIVDTLGMARQRHPGQRNTLDALCVRYGIDRSARELHGALIDARLLAEVYLSMTAGQVSLLDDEVIVAQKGSAAVPLPKLKRLGERPRLPVIAPTDEERAAHERIMDAIDTASGGRCLWRQNGFG